MNMTCHSFENICRDYNPERMAKSDLIHTHLQTLYALLDGVLRIHPHTLGVSWAKQNWTFTVPQTWKRTKENQSPTSRPWASAFSTEGLSHKYGKELFSSLLYWKQRESEGVLLIGNQAGTVWFPSSKRPRPLQWGTRGVAVMPAATCSSLLASASRVPFFLPLFSLYSLRSLKGRRVERRS